MKKEFEEVMAKVSGLGLRMRIAREDSELSQIALAELVGTTQSMISKFELGSRRITVDMAALIANELGISVQYLILGETNDS